MDRRIVKTREAIRKAYLELITEKSASRISISELSRRANIDRKSFYLHYASPDEVLIEYVEDKFSMIAAAMEESDYFEDPFNVENLVYIIDRFYKEEEEMLLAVAESDAYDDLWRKVHDILTDKAISLYAPLVKIDTDEITVFYDFLSAGVIDVYRRWAHGEYSYDLLHLVEMIGNATKTGLAPYLISK
ncbi:MAG: TetR/AcrR family transcriptional regulator [Mogibacterium sp.]|nr:TetR/AcrR family transcriptional regulator [Mogibacterium sp.]